MMTGEISLDDWNEKSKSGKKNDQNEVDGMKREVEGDACRNERFVIFKEKDDGV